MDDKTPREILNRFYSDNNFGADGGESKSYVKIDFTPKIHMYFPNFDARRKAVLKHDIHHILTGYETTLIGESEISAWEIGSGCKKYWAALMLDTSGLMMGILINFWRVLKAFARGRRTKNLYHELFSDEEALDMKISDLREKLDLEKYPKDTKPTLADFFLFTTFAIVGEIYSIIVLLFFPLLILYSIYIEVKIRRAGA